MENGELLVTYFAFADQIGLFENEFDQSSLPSASLGEFQHAHEEQNKSAETDDQQHPKHRLFRQTMWRKIDVEHIDQENVFENIIFGCFRIGSQLINGLQH